MVHLCKRWVPISIDLVVVVLQRQRNKKEANVLNKAYSATALGTNRCPFFNGNLNICGSPQPFYLYTLATHKKYALPSAALQKLK